ncbi:MAG: malto-oligosyltrehalose synthase [Planctomycetes bacterium]|nr:malto-oligosyltrehalose synthase [Planctomycetota bacterium]
MNPTSLPFRIPSASYRLQFHRDFTFRDAADLVEYLHALGISDVYASPLLAARAGSRHGYDVVDPSRLNPELGGEEDLLRFATRLKERSMSLILDVVPNHMCISDSANPWWRDVLENGPSSPYAAFFDIDWNPPKAELCHKVLIPSLSDQFGKVLENQEIQVHHEGGAFSARYADQEYPLDPKSWPIILRPVLDALKECLGESQADVQELESILSALEHLPSRTDTEEAKVKERQREKEVIKRRVAALTETRAEERSALEASLRDLNGRREDPRSFDRLDRLLDDQAYRLAYWRVAIDEVNYRRFFDINELAAIRVEHPGVFDEVHARLLDLMRRGVISGLRIDHVDGLHDPQQYLQDLQAACRRTLNAPSGEGRCCWIVVEKILGADERLRPDWPVQGTTGYDFLNQLNGLFVHPAGEKPIRRFYELLTGIPRDFEARAYSCKKLILKVSLSSEHHVLARKLDRISEQHRWSRDFTFNSLYDALGEVLACFPVYRTYLRGPQAAPGEEDRRHILTALRTAKRLNPATSESIFDFIGSILLGQEPLGLSDANREERLRFVMSFQQLTAPVMAKAVEDTAFYRHYPLASLNEVGGDPSRWCLSPDEFHRRNAERRRNWPHGLLATTTHDSKRCEDVRARLNALSEIPALWERAVLRWREMNRPQRVALEGVEAPDANEEYLLYQTLAGTWPPERPAGVPDGTVLQIQNYMLKAIREAKIHTSWINPNEPYEQAVMDFIRRLLDPSASRRFLADFRKFLASLIPAAMFSSLSQVLLKICAPGVPDFYQGSELWDLRLVDPDNRGPVDFATRRAMLASLDEETDLARRIAQMVRALEDGRIKLFVISRALRFRRDHPERFTTGEYVPLHASGARAAHVCAFARAASGGAAIAVAGRFFMSLEAGRRPPVGARIWKKTLLPLTGLAHGGAWRDVLSGREVRAVKTGGSFALLLEEVFAHLPVALLRGPER